MQISELFWTTHKMPYTTIGDGVDYAFVEEGETLYIFFQGSSQAVDWINNFSFAKRPYKDMKIPYRVHGGFLKCWKQVEDLVIAKITEKYIEPVEEGDNSLPIERYKFNRVIVSGYSHGAALAAFCHECVWFWRPDIRDVCWSYGFEGPRIYGGFKVKKELRERWEHFVLIRNNTDIVTHCPPKLFGFCDIGTVLHIGRFQDYGRIKSHFPENVYNSLKEINFEIGGPRWSLISKTPKSTD